MTYLSPQDITKVSDQEGLIDKAKQEGVDAICIAPNNPTKLNAKLKAASRSGIQIFTIDSDVTLDEKSDCFTERRPISEPTMKPSAELLPDRLRRFWQSRVRLQEQSSSVIPARRILQHNV